MAFCMLLGARGYLQAQKKQQTAQTRPFQPKDGQPGKDVVWVPTPQVLVDKMLDLATVTPQDYVIDLGSGDGRIVITAAKRGARALGIEYNPDLVELSKANAAKESVSDKATFMKADVFEADFSKATVITIFLSPSINLRLRPKLLDMKPGTRIVSDSFDMGDWKPDQTAPSVGECRVVIEGSGPGAWCAALLWIVPAKAAGNWQLSSGELTLTQQFQMLSGTLTLNGNKMPISNAKMLGDQIVFGAGGNVYIGRLTGNVIEGTAKAIGSNVSWRATRAKK